MMLRPPRSTLFPHTTLVRSDGDDPAELRVGAELAARPPQLAHPRGRDAPDVGAEVEEDGGHCAELNHGGEPGSSEEHTSELQPRQYLVCRLLLDNNNRPAAY